jgi:hypothetical protein
MTSLSMWLPQKERTAISGPGKMMEVLLRRLRRRLTTRSSTLLLPREHDCDVDEQQQHGRRYSSGNYSHENHFLSGGNTQA